jgi:hypothetical protein
LGLRPIDDLATFTRTRTSWHALAEHVLARARFEATGRIGLQADDEGILTPHYGDDLRVRLTVDGIVREQYGERFLAPITTLAAAAQFVETPLGAPPLYTPSGTDLAPDEPLAVDAAAARQLVLWLGFATALLGGWRDENRAGEPSLVQLWPEHFDLAFELGDPDAGARANYGASPGDAAIAEPYLYVGPWTMEGLDDPFWNHEWGAALPYTALCAAPDPHVVAVSFLAHGHARLASH